MQENGTRAPVSPATVGRLTTMRYLERIKVAVLAACPAYQQISAQGRREE